MWIISSCMFGEEAFVLFESSCRHLQSALNSKVSASDVCQNMLPRTSQRGSGWARVRASWPGTRATAVVWDAIPPRDYPKKDGLKVVVEVLTLTTAVSKCVHERVNRFGRTCVDTFPLCRSAVVRCTSLYALPRFACGVCCPQWLVLKHDCRFPPTFPGLLIFALHGRICASRPLAWNSFDCLECLFVAGFLGDLEALHCEHRLSAANTGHISCCRRSLTTLFQLSHRIALAHVNEAVEAG